MSIYPVRSMALGVLALAAFGVGLGGAASAAEFTLRYGIDDDQNINRLPQVVALQRRVNSPGWRRAMAARKRIDDLVDTQIAGARAEPRPDDHLLTMLINGRGEEGYALSDNEIRDAVISLITAGYETTSGAMASSRQPMGPGVPDRFSKSRKETPTLPGS